MSTSRRSSVAEAHDIYLKYHRHREGELNGGGSEGSYDGESPNRDLGGRDHKPHGVQFQMFHRVMKTGVIYATSRATARGFDPEHCEDWANMGQGAPETGPLPGSPSRDFTMTIPDAELEYAPVTGLPELREKVANYYNHLYRQGKASQYTKDNVCIVPGGRAGITRIMAILGTCQVGFFSPDYTAYEQALGLFLRVSPSPLLHRNINEAVMPVEDFNFECRGRGLGSVLLSNPANPTGQSIEGDRLKEYVEVARSSNTSIIMDEFYSHYYYDGEAKSPADGGADDDSNWPKTVSSASYIDDVNADPILIVNGLTKNWRCPGFRVCWIVAPKEIVQMLGSAGSYLDGGANAPLQRLALPLMELDFVRRDAWALQAHFQKKRDYLLKELEQVGIRVQWKPTATFYVWADISGLKEPLNDSLVFLEECLKRKVICVPGVFFDINPRGLKEIERSSCIGNMRFSYGPPMENLVEGMKQIKAMVAYWNLHQESCDSYADREL